MDEWAKCRLCLISDSRRGKMSSLLAPKMSKMVIFGQKTPKMMFLGQKMTFFAPKTSFSAFCLPKNGHFCHFLPQKHHFHQFLPKNGHFSLLGGKQRQHLAPTAIRYQAKTTFCPFLHQKMTFFAPKMPFLVIFPPKMAIFPLLGYWVHYLAARAQRRASWHT